MTGDNNCLEHVDSAIRDRDFPRAQALLEKIIEDPERICLDNLIRYGFILEAQMKFGDAVDVFETAETHARQTADKIRLLNRASDLLSLQYKENISRNVLERMAGFLERSIELDASRQNIEAISKLCSIYQTIKNVNGLMTQASRLETFPEYSHQARLWLAAACYQLGHRKQGLAYLRKIAQARAQLNQQQLFWLTGLLIQYRSFDSAQTLIDYCTDQGFEDERLLEYQAQVYFESGYYENVLSCVTSDSLSGCTNPETRRRLYFYRGKSLEQKADFASAHECFVEMNKIAGPKYSRDGQTDAVQAYRKAINSRLPVFKFTEPAPYQRVFMVAFPRSGTTLLETILDTQPGILTLSEVDAVSAVRRTLEDSTGKYPEVLSTLSQTDVSALRETYAEQTGDYLQDIDTCSVVIDKLPLNIIHIPLIKTLFPEAKFILSLRHPLDVCLSCFQQDFLLNDEMAFFTDLETCFTRYRDVMNLVEQYREKLDLDLLAVRYEDLVEDFDQTAARVFGFLGINPDESYKSFHSINRDKLIATPSRNQVVRPLYQTSRYRWTNYTDQLLPHLHHVRPFIDLYGYPPGPGT